MVNEIASLEKPELLIVPRYKLIHISMEPFVSIIILNWNNWKDTIVCLESILNIRYKNYKIIVIDNDSTDNSINSIKEYLDGEITVESPFFSYKTKNKPVLFTELSEENIDNQEMFSPELSYQINTYPCIIIKNSKNYGFAVGNNIGMKFALRYFSPAYVFLLNNDTVVTPDFLSELINVAEKDPNVGICAPKLLKMNDPRIIDSTGHVFSGCLIHDRGEGQVDEGQFDDKIEIVGAIAAGSLYRKEMLESIGLFDPDFGTGYEDAELSWRAYTNGWSARFVPKSIIYHKRGGTIKRDKAIQTDVNYLSESNIVQTVKRYGTKRQKLLYGMILLKAAILSPIGRVLGKNKQSVRRNWELFFDLGLFRKSKKK